MTIENMKDNLKTNVPDEAQSPAFLVGAIRPPLGLIPKKFHDERVKVERFNEVCGVIARYYNAGKKINI